MPTRQYEHLFRQRLLAWYKKFHRDLPWRRTHDPYGILVSEMMLQQTQVDRVLKKYHSWMKRFPSVHLLAGASRSSVILQWQGLGYNRRALYLQRIAQSVVADFGGEFPKTTKELLTLPGVGPYTARALMSFAYKAHEPIVDTNVRRVAGRIFFGYKKLLRAHEGDVWALVDSLMPRDVRSYFFNQALMDFGALTCTARKPKCTVCPMRNICRSYPDILKADANALRVKKAVTEKLYFRYPRRIWRGKILAYMHTPPASKGATAGAIGKAIQSDFTPDRIPWLRTVIATLEKDGLVERHGQRVHLPTV